MGQQREIKTLRIIWVLSGLSALFLGLVGIILPLLPTVPFLLLAAFCFARSSKHLHHWLIYHPKLGPPIQEWNEKGSIRRSAKIWASVSILVAFTISIIFEVKINVLLIQAVVLTCVMIFIWSRPES